MRALSFDPRRCFAAGYGEARERFLEAASEAGATIREHDQAGTGPGGEDLRTSVARWGPQDATRVLMVQSGTHGIELGCGSGGQLACITAGVGECADDRTAVVLVHAINPWGAAWELRETREGVDLNRNLRDHGRPPPANAEYAELHADLRCPALEGPERRAADERLETWRRARGDAAFWRAVGSGQYTHADGLYYGGRAPTASARTFLEVLETEARGAGVVAFVDVHSGLGPYGHGMVISMSARESPDLVRERRCFGPSLVAPLAGEGEVPKVEGHLEGAVHQALPDARVLAVALEFGTLDPMNDLTTHRDRLWLRDHGEFDDARGRRIRAAFRRHFAPDDPDWQAAVAFRTVQVVDAARRGLEDDVTPPADT